MAVAVVGDDEMWRRAVPGTYWAPSPSQRPTRKFANRGAATGRVGLKLGTKHEKAENAEKIDWLGVW